MKKLFLICLCFIACSTGIKHNEISIPLIKQTRVSWCWAAVGAMTFAFTHHIIIRDCDVAREFLDGVPDCCNDTWACNEKISLSDFQSLLSKIFIPMTALSSNPSFDEIVQYIDTGNILIIATALDTKGIGGHIGIINGYVYDSQQLIITDPYFGTGKAPYTNLTSGQFGLWVFTGVVGERW